MKCVVSFKYSNCGWKPAGPETYDNEMDAARAADELQKAFKMMAEHVPGVPVIDDWHVVPFEENSGPPQKVPPKA